jgi:hypothetical protein
LTGTTATRASLRIARRVLIGAWAASLGSLPAVVTQEPPLPLVLERQRAPDLTELTLEALTDVAVTSGAKSRSGASLVGRNLPPAQHPEFEGVPPVAVQHEVLPKVTPRL